MKTTPARGEIYYIEIAEGEAVGRELKGGHWWVVLSGTELNDVNDVFLAVPLTSVINKKTQEAKDVGNFRHFRIRVPKTSKTRDPGNTDVIFNDDSIALPHQMRTFSYLRTKERAGVVHDLNALSAIESGLLFVIRAGIRRLVPEEPRTQVIPAASEVRARMPIEPPKPLPGKPVKES